MKKVIVSIVLVAIAATNSFASNERGVNNRALFAFKQEFTEASDVKWKAEPTYVLASFLLDNKRFEALYTHAGEKIGVQTQFNFEQLPTAVKRRLAKKYDGYAIKETIDFRGEEENAYYIAAENDTQKVYLKVEGVHLTEVKRLSK